MKTVKRTFFNKLFQPKRIGKRICKRKSAIKRLIIRFYMVMTRRSHQGQANAILGRNCKVKKTIRHPFVKNYKSKFVKRARLND